MQPDEDDSEEEDDELLRMNAQIQSLIQNGQQALSTPISSPKKKRRDTARHSTSGQIGYSMEEDAALVFQQVKGQQGNWWES